MTGGGTGTPLGSRRNRFREFWYRVYQKSAEDNVFFMAGAISYNLLIAVVPLFLLVVGLWGYVLRARYGDPSQVIVRLLENYIPAVGGDIDLMAEMGSAINGLVAGRAGYSVVGSLLFIWLATRLVSTLRSALREVFDIAADRGILRGKLFDVQVVVIGGVLRPLERGDHCGSPIAGGVGSGAHRCCGGVPGDHPEVVGGPPGLHLHLGTLRPDLLVRAGSENSVADGVAGRDRHGRVVRSDEVGLRLVRHLGGGLPLHDMAT